MSWLKLFFGKVGAQGKRLLPRLPDSHHSAALQKTPFNINRYVLLIIYVVYTFLSSCTYFGWRNLSHMLIKSGAYAWLCDEGNSGAGEEEGKRYLCDAQDTHVQQLFTIAMACHFTMSACAGVLIDIVGPKITATIGQALNFIGWMLLAFCGADFRAYIAAFIFIGAGADTGFLPTLLLANVFPGSAALCMAILGSAVSASFSIPLILDTIWMNNNDTVSFFSLCIGYVLCGPVLCALVALLFLPFKPFYGADTVVELTQENGSVDSNSNENSRKNSDAGIEHNSSNAIVDRDAFSNEQTDVCVYYGEMKNSKCNAECCSHNTCQDDGIDDLSNSNCNNCTVHKRHNNYQTSIASPGGKSTDVCTHGSSPFYADDTSFSSSPLSCHKCDVCTTHESSQDICMHINCEGECVPGGMKKNGGKANGGDGAGEKSMQKNSNNNNNISPHKYGKASEEVEEQTTIIDIELDDISCVDKQQNNSSSRALSTVTTSSNGDCSDEENDLPTPSDRSTNACDNNHTNESNKVKDIKQETRFYCLVVSKFYLAICIYFIMCSLAMAYYQEAAGRLFSTRVENTLAMLVPFSFVPCIIIGKMIDTYGIMPIILFINFVGTVMYFFVCFNVVVLHYMSAVLYMTYISVYTSQLYCYINDTFVSHHFGKLLGLASCLGGLLSLVTHFLYDNVTVNALRGNTLRMNIVFVCSLGLLFPILICVMLSKRRMAKSALTAVEFTHAT